MLQSETSQYFDRYGFKPQLIQEKPDNSTNVIIVIPCFNEKHLVNTLNSLSECLPQQNPIEVIIVINQGEKVSTDISDRNKSTFEEAQEWIGKNKSQNLNFQLLYCDDLPQKHAGVGLARKIGMDEASRRFDSVDNSNGLIVCFDADCTVEKNYLIELETFESSFKKANGCSIHFEHPLSGELNKENYNGILNYELHLRYYVHALRFAGFKLAHQTIGSSMAVRSKVYQKQGGMNRRKAGEDFYFLSKIIPLGNFHDLNSTTVYPSPRESDRVPFGTGKAITDFINLETPDNYMSYSFDSFKDLKELIINLPSIFEQKEFKELVLPHSIQEYLKTINGTNRFENILKQSPKWETFESRFYSWFDGLKVLKFIHFCRDHYYPNNKIKNVILDWNTATNILDINSDSTKKEILLRQRQLDKSPS